MAFENPPLTLKSPKAGICFLPPYDKTLESTKLSSFTFKR